MLTSEERVLLLVRKRFHGSSTPIAIRRANIYTVRDDNVVEVSMSEGDESAADELLH